jgi:hypothetical protein
MPRYRIEAQEFDAEPFERSEWMNPGLEIKAEYGAAGQLSPMAVRSLGLTEIATPTAFVRRCSCGCVPLRWRVYDPSWKLIAEFRDRPAAITFAEVTFGEGIDAEQERDAARGEAPTSNQDAE